MQVDWHVSLGQLVTPVVIIGGGVWAWFRHLKKVDATLNHLNKTLGDFPLHKHNRGLVVYPDGKIEPIFPKREVST